MRLVFSVVLFSLVFSCGEAVKVKPLTETNSPTPKVKTSAYGPKNIVRCVYQDKSGVIWFGTWEGIFCYDAARAEASENGQGAAFINFTEQQGLDNFPVFSIVEDKAGAIWFATGGGGVWRYNGRAITRFTRTSGLAGDTVYTAIADQAGQLWFGTWGSGVSRYDGKVFTNYSTQHGLVENSISRIFEDKAGTIWIATYHNGLCFCEAKMLNDYASPTANTRFTKYTGACNYDVRCMLQDRNNAYWFGTGTGVCCLKGKSVSNYTKKDGLGSHRVYSMLEDKNGNIWLGTEDGLLSRYSIPDSAGALPNSRPGNFTNFPLKPITGYYIFCMLQDAAGYLWLGSSEGIWRYDGKRLVNFTKEGLTPRDAE